MLINLEVSTKKEINELIKFIYASVTIKNVYIFENEEKKIYCNRLNKWHGDETSEKCNGYEKCDFNDQITTSEHIQYSFSYSPKLGTLMLFDENAKNILKNNDLNEIYLKCSKPIIFYNYNGFNKDHRGSDHTKLLLDFHSIYKLNPNDNTISLKKFADACFRIKSHKFDFWYELYYDVKNVKHTDDEIIINLAFDHGS
jgi:hypothetical protein